MIVLAFTLSHLAKSSTQLIFSGSHELSDLSGIAQGLTTKDGYISLHIFCPDTL